LPEDEEEDEDEGEKIAKCKREIAKCKMRLHARNLQFAFPVLQFAIVPLVHCGRSGLMHPTSLAHPDVLRTAYRSS
jgi:hypothetical protein